MATAYPTYSITLGSSQEEDEGITDDFSQAGTQHSRTYYSQSYYIFTIYHVLTLAEFDTLKALYVLDKRGEYTLNYLNVIPSVTYTVKFTAPPQKVENLGGGIYRVKVMLRGTEV